MTARRDYAPRTERPAQPESRWWWLLAGVQFAFMVFTILGWLEGR